MKPFTAVYENSVLRPLDHVELQDHARFEVQVRPLPSGNSVPSLDAVYAILNKRFDSGEHDVAARHDEHQP